MIFVDSGAWIAFVDRGDPYHSNAVAIYNDLVQQRTQLLTTDYVIDETITRLRYDCSHSVAVQFLDLIKSSKATGVLTVVEIDSVLFQEAEQLFRQYDTAKLSFTDCTSFVVCQRQQYKISEAFAFDQDFSIIGIILRGEPT